MVAVTRTRSTAAGVVVYPAVPVYDVLGQTAYAYLHVVGVPRTLPSHVLRVFLNDDNVPNTAPPEHPSFAGEYLTYNSPPPPGPMTLAPPPAEEQGPYELSLDISPALERIDRALGAGPNARGRRTRTVDVTFVLLDLDGNPLTSSVGRFAAVSITRRA